MVHAANDVAAMCQARRGELELLSKGRLAAAWPPTSSQPFQQQHVGDTSEPLNSLTAPATHLLDDAESPTPASLPLGSQPLAGQPPPINLSSMAEQLSAANSGWAACNNTVAACNTIASGLQGVAAQLQACKAAAAVQQACQASKESPDASAAALLEACELGRTAAEAAHQACHTSYDACLQELRTRQAEEVRGGARGGAAACI